MTRIAVCRFCFLLLCVVPTLATGGFIALHWLSIRSPAAKAEWERELSQRLGVAVAMEGLCYPQPSLAELTGVALTDPETKLPLGECRRVEIERTRDRWQVRLVEPSIARGGLPALIRRVHDAAFAFRHEQVPPVRLAAGQLTVEGPEQAQSLTNISAEWNYAAGGPALTMKFAMPGDEQWATLRIARNGQITPPVTQIEWDFPAPLPASLVTSAVPDLAALGNQATYVGSGRLLWRPGSLRGQFAGEIRGIDLTRLIGDRFPHMLTGNAICTLEQAMLEDGRLTSARGTLVVSGGGRISRSLLSAAREHLELDGELPPEGTESVVYESLALRFELTEQGLRLGSMEQLQPGIIAASDGPLLSTSENMVPAVALVRTLVPDSNVQVPATKQTAVLLSLLPLPAIDPPQSVRRSVHTPTRLGRASTAERRGNPIRERPLR